MEDKAKSKPLAKKEPEKAPVSKPEGSAIEGCIPVSKVVKVKNISKGVVNTSKGIIEPGKTGECTGAESRTLNKVLKVV